MEHAQINQQLLHDRNDVSGSYFGLSHTSTNRNLLIDFSIQYKGFTADLLHFIIWIYAASN